MIYEYFFIAHAVPAWPVRYGLRVAAARLPGQVLDGLPGARQHGARAAAGSHGRGQGELGLAERGHVTTVLTSNWLQVMLGTDYPFPLGEVRICDTWPGKVVEQSKYSDSVKVDIIMLDTDHIHADIVIL